MATISESSEKEQIEEQNKEMLQKRIDELASLNLHGLDVNEIEQRIALARDMRGGNGGRPQGCYINTKTS